MGAVPGAAPTKLRPVAIAPEPNYARAGELFVAYQSLGAGPDLMYVPKGPDLLFGYTRNERS